MPGPRNRERIARNFIETHGKAAFRKLVDALATGESGQSIAKELGVSRERIRQWKNAFGEMYMVYQLHPEVERLLGKEHVPVRTRLPAITFEMDETPSDEAGDPDDDS